MQARAHDAWMRWGGGRELTQRTLDDFGVVGLLGGNTGTQMGGRAMERLGVVPQTLAGGEIYGVLERGAIDATEWVGPYDDERMGFHRVVKTYHYPGWWEPSAALSFYVDRQAWDGAALGVPRGAALSVGGGQRLDAEPVRRPQLSGPGDAAGARSTDGPVLPGRDASRRPRLSRPDGRAGLMDELAADAHGRALLTSYRDVQAASDGWQSLAERAMAGALRP